MSLAPTRSINSAASIKSRGIRGLCCCSALKFVNPVCTTISESLQTHLDHSMGDTLSLQLTASALVPTLLFGVVQRMLDVTDTDEQMIFS